MTNISSPISSTSSVGSGVQANNSPSSTADLISSFKDILSVMTATSGLSSSGQSAGMGMNMSDLMAPLMLIMIEKLLDLELSQGSPTGTADQASTASTAQALTGSTSMPSTNTGLSTTASGARSEPSGWPVQGRITQEPHSGHMAFDIAVPLGTPIKTTMDGKVVHAGWNNQGYGNLVIVENGPYRTYYAHLSSIPVSVGDQVSAGSVIGLSGSTGNSTGPHLHYEIRRDKVAIDPSALTRGMS